MYCTVDGQLAEKSDRHFRVLVVTELVLSTLSFIAGILGGAAVGGPVGAVVGGFLGSALGTVVGAAAGWVGADVRRTLGEHDVFGRGSSAETTEQQEQERAAVEAERKSDEQNRI